MIINRSATLAIREYLTPQGENTFREWLKTLDVGVQARIQARVLRFENGNLGDHKNVGGGVWEARFRFWTGVSVILWKRWRCSDLASCGRQQKFAIQRYRRGKTLLERL